MLSIVGRFKDLKNQHAMNLSQADEKMQDEAYEYMAARSKPGPILIFTFFLIFIYVSPIYHDQPFEIMIVGISLFLIMVIRLYNEFQFTKLYFRNKIKWKRTYSLTISVNAFIWGIFCLIVVREYEIHWVSLLVLVCTAGFSAGGILAVIPHQKLSLAFQSFILLPTAFYSFTLDNAAAYSISYMFLSYLIFMSIMSKKLHSEYWTSVENVRLLDQRAAELEISRDEAIELAKIKSTFLATMSHELRTPMNGILGMSQLLELSKLDDEQNEYVMTIKDSTNSLLTLINDILDYSKADSGNMIIKPKHFNMQDFINEIVTLLKPATDEKNLKLMVEIPTTMNGDYIGDPGRIRQVIMNLLGNAIKFTENGSISLVLNTSDKKSSSDVRFNIIDTGIGINESTQKSIFSEFTQADTSSTRKYGGTGLGLAISKQIVKLMEGEIGVTSMENVGSTFWFQIPLAKIGITEESINTSRKNSDALILNVKTISQLQETMEDQFPQLVTQHIKTMESNLEKIRICIEDGDTENLLIYLQSLSSSSASIGASSLEVEAALYEKKIREKSMPIDELAYKKLTVLANDVTAALLPLIE